MAETKKSMGEKKGKLVWITYSKKFLELSNDYGQPIYFAHVDPKELDERYIYRY